MGDMAGITVTVGGDVLVVFALGGINDTKRIRETRLAGAHGVAMISAIIAAPDVKRITAEFLNALEIEEDSY